MAVEDGPGICASAAGGALESEPQQRSARMLWPEEGQAIPAAVPIPGWRPDLCVSTRVLVSAALDLNRKDPPVTQTLAERAEALRQEIGSVRTTLARLRDPAGAIRLAVQILAGPLRPLMQRLEPGPRGQVSDVLTALEASAQELCRALETAGAANEQPLGGETSQPAAPSCAAVPDAPPAAQPPAAQPAPKEASADVAALLRRLEVLTVTRSALPALLAVDAPQDVQLRNASPDLLGVLCGLVENAIEASARAKPNGAPWTVDVRAFVDPAEDFGEALDLVFEIRDRGDGLPDELVRWCSDPEPSLAPDPDGGPGTTLNLARRIVEDASGRLEFIRTSRRTAVRMRFPHQR